MRFSVVIPVFNSEKYIDRCLNSIINQTYKNIEIIIIDDGSSDRSYEICEKKSKKDKRIKLIKQANKGVSFARNLGIEESKGDFIVFVDSDDYLEDTAIEVCNNNIKDNDLLICEIAYIVNEKKIYIPCKLNGEYTTKTLLESLNNRKNIKLAERINSVCGKVYRADIIKLNQIRFDECISIGEDLLFNIYYLEKIKKIKWIDYAIYNYYKNNIYSCTNDYKKNKFMELNEVSNSYERLLDTLGDKKLFDIVKYIRVKNIYSCILDLFHEKCDLKFKEKLKYIKNIKNITKRKVVIGKGFGFFCGSIIYSFLPEFLLLLICKIIFFYRSFRLNIRKGDIG